MKLTIKYPNEPPEILSLISTTMNITPSKLENSGKKIPKQENNCFTFLFYYRW
jgi:hypothetical protein